MKMLRYLTLILMLSTINSVYSQSPAENGPPPCIDNDPPEMGNDMDHHQMHNRKIPPRMIKKAMEYLKTDFPDFYDKLSGLKDDNPEIFRRTMHKFSRFIKNHNKSKKEKQDIINIFESEIDIDLLIDKYVSVAEINEKKNIKKDIMKKMSENFDMKEEMKLKLIRRIEKNLEEKKKIYDLRRKKKDEILKNDLEKMIMDREMEEELKK